VRYDRDELLARTDLTVLADELLGFHVGNGRNARWPSPVPNHPQTGRTPPMSIFVDHRGIERWTCFATGANGTAIDLVMVATGRSVGDAIGWLAERARLDRPPPERPPPVRRDPPSSPPPARGPSTALKEYVEACERILWQPAGAAIRHWLVEERCLDPEVLRLNRVGADPGPRTLRRAKGLPRQGLAAVFPALDDRREPVYLQARYLRPPPNRGKYDNPSGGHGRNPRVTTVEPAAAASGLTLVTEGIPDALAAASAGYRGVAIFGAGVPDGRLTTQLAKTPGLLVVAFDADEAGRAGANRVLDLIRREGRSDVVCVEPADGDLNAWLASRGREPFRKQLELSINLAASGLRSGGRARSIA
jgi:DNA primase